MVVGLPFDSTKFLFASGGSKLLKIVPTGPNTSCSQAVKGNISLPTVMDYILLPGRGNGRLFFADNGRNVISSVNFNGTGINLTLDRRIVRSPTAE